MSTQVANPGKVELDASYFQLRNDPGFAWSRLVSGQLLMPKTAGLWTFANVDENDNALDLSGNGQIMTPSGAGVTYGLYGVTPYVQFDGSSYMSTPSVAINRITGALCLSCWVWFDDISGTQTMISKYLPSPGFETSYLINKDTFQRFNFSVSNDGAFSYLATNALVPPQAGKWFHLIGEYIPSTSLTLWVNGIPVVNSTSIPASIYDGPTIPLILGNTDSFLSPLKGRLALVRLGRSAINSALARLNFDYARPAFGVTA